MSLELLIGVVHHPDFLGITKHIIASKYSQGIESMMLELQPAFDNDGCNITDGFFTDLAEYYKGKGTKIVYGDVFRVEIPKKIITKKQKEYTLQDYLSYIGFVIKDTLLCFGDIITFRRKRDKKMLEVIEKEDPQVAVVGRGHADYIKKRMPNVKYIAQTVSDFNVFFRTFNYLFGPYKPDEVVYIDKLKIIT